MNIVCIGMDEQGNYFVGKLPQEQAPPPPPGQMGQPPAPPQPGAQPDPASYLQPVASLNEAFAAARDTLMNDTGGDKEAQFDAGVKAVLGPRSI